MAESEVQSKRKLWQKWARFLTWIHPLPDLFIRFLGNTDNTQTSSFTFCLALMAWTVHTTHGDAVTTIVTVINHHDFKWDCHENPKSSGWNSLPAVVLQSALISWCFLIDMVDLHGNRTGSLCLHSTCKPLAGSGKDGGKRHPPPKLLTDKWRKTW